MSIAIALLAGVLLGWLGSRSLRGTERYADPQLHSGVFNVAIVRGAFVWEATLAKGAEVKLGKGHHHSVKQCTITHGLAHVDVCWCGAQRYGVFGAWS